MCVLDLHNLTAFDINKCFGWGVPPLATLAPVVVEKYIKRCFFAEATGIRGFISY